MDFNNNNFKGFSFNFGKGPGKGNQQASSKGFRESFEDFKQEMRTRDNNRKGKNPFIIILATLVIMLAFFFVTLPALNFMAQEFYSFLIVAILVYNGLNLLFGKMSIMRTGFVSIILVGILIVAPIVLGFLSQPIFNAKRYSALIPVEDANFAETVEEISYDKVPVVDRDAAVVIGARQMGSVQEVVSQFEINENYTQINIKGVPVRVSPLAYSDLIKYFLNFRNGIPYFVQIDMATQEADLIRLAEPLKYSKSDILMRDITRHMRFRHPTKMFGETNFEVDDQGKGFYITSVLTRRIGMFGGTDVKGAIVTNGNTGESTYYDVADVPSWVDRVYPSNLVIQQLDYRGSLAGGFINSIFGQKNVTRTTQGYNYVPLNDDIYLYTGSTSIRSDSSNLGFYFVNLRTKEAKFFSVPSADEFSAMNSATGQIQEKNYTPAFPVLLNIQDRPTYLIGLKDASGLAKMFALVDAENYQNVSVGDNVQDVMNQYYQRMDTSGVPGADADEQSIVIERIQSVVIDGNTIYYIMARGEDMVYVGNAKKLGASIVFAKPGDTLKVFGNPKDNQFDILEIR